MQLPPIRFLTRQKKRRVPKKTLLNVWIAGIGICLYYKDISETTQDTVALRLGRAACARSFKFFAASNQHTSYKMGLVASHLQWH